AVVGVNCGSGPESLTEPARRLVAARLGLVLAAPNAGLPRMSGGRALYDLSPDAFARAAIEFRELGVRLFAGCCGTTPEHLRAAGRVFRGSG
ncbi:MAG TPA: homocysteine S-methyltransferase family protein, partial [Armatimonadota bacterium]|nr:homocysteine S-methyltransferase family protein [Armatimonadota bacterium]